MKIRKVFENEEKEMSNERVGEMIEDIRNFSSEIDDKIKLVDSLLNELTNFQTRSKSSNDQIDDSILALQVIRKDINNIVDKSDTIMNNLTSYNEDGRKYIYSDDEKTI